MKNNILRSGIATLALAAASPAYHADCFQVPVLLVHGTTDMNVGSFKSDRMEDRLEEAGRSVQYVEYEGFDLYLDHGQVRGNMLLAIDTFLTEHLAD